MSLNPYRDFLEELLQAESEKDIYFYDDRIMMRAYSGELVPLKRSWGPIQVIRGKDYKDIEDIPRNAQSLFETPLGEGYHINDIDVLLFPGEAVTYIQEECKGCHPVLNPEQVMDHYEIDLLIGPFFIHYRTSPENIQTAEADLERIIDGASYFSMAVDASAETVSAAFAAPDRYVPEVYILQDVLSAGVHPARVIIVRELTQSIVYVDRRYWDMVEMA